jgi:hypothetical protein
MGRIVIVAYQPKPGMDEALMTVVRRHMSVLQSENLITERVAYVMRAADGTVVEVFEWQSADAISKAHSLPAVQELWAEFGAACNYRPLAEVPECQQLFAEFDPVSMESLPLSE